MLKPYNELVKVDVLPSCDYRKARDDKGKEIEVPYLNWAKCVELLHANGAEAVYYTPIKAADGGYLFTSKTVQDKHERTTGCYFVAVEIHIDDLVFSMDMPLLNGSLVVYDDTLNQLRISNCHARAFVKGVAIRTGLGFQLWSAEKDTDAAQDDLSIHNIFAIKERIGRIITAKERRGMDHRDLLSAVGISEKQLAGIMGYFDTIDKLEKHIAAL